MSLHKQPDLKRVVLELSEKEKDKLLVRLIGKDKMLMKQLHFQLLEDESDLQHRIEQLQTDLQEIIGKLQQEISDKPSAHNFRELNIELRRASGIINEHEKVTKDKLSDFEGRLYLLENTFRLFPSLFTPTLYVAGTKLRRYMVGRIKNVQSKYDKIHEDLQFDYQEQMDFILQFAEEHDLKSI